MRIVTLVTLLLLSASFAHAAPKKKLDLRSAELYLTTLEGGKTKLVPYAGKKITLVNLWATWCPPCVEEMPSLAKLHDKYKAQGFAIVGVDVDESPAIVREFLAKHGVSYPVLATTPEKTLAALGDLQGLPTSLVLDASGDVTDVLEGAIEVPEFEKTLAQLLAGPKRKLTK